MKKLLLLLGGTLLLAGAGPSAAGPGSPISVTAHLIASPASATLYCPATIAFQGTITVTGPCTVQYRFVRSDGTQGNAISLPCPVAGPRKVKTEWTLSGSYSGWEKIEVIAPQAVTSNQATFSLTCKPRPAISVGINGPDLNYDGSLYIQGSNFGATQGTLNVSLDGQPALPRPGWSVSQWTSNRIVLQTRICDITIWDHTYQLAITDAGRVVSNVVPVKFVYPFHRSPGGDLVVSAGHELTLNLQNLPLSRIGYALRMAMGTSGATLGEGKNLKILNWQGAVHCNPGTITVLVPAETKTGVHYIWLMQGNTVCSDDETQVRVMPAAPVSIPIKK
jgi:hypothetical protein